MDKKVLIIEDEVPIAKILSYALKSEGFTTQMCHLGKEGLDAMDSFIPDIILLDIMLPDIDGFEICKEITKSRNAPIVMITAKSDIVDKLLGLQLGADDYIVKPFDVREVIMRIKNILKRVEKANIIDSSKIIIKNIEILKLENKVLKNNQEIILTPKEYDLLLFFAENRGIVFTRDQIIEKIWGYDFLGDSRTIDIHILRIRKKLEDEFNKPLIETVFKRGYRMIKN